MKNLRIAIIGNIGVGKSTLIEALEKSPLKEILLSMCNSYELEKNLYVFPEEFDPKVLDAFYKDPVKHAFTAQIEFLNARLKRQSKIQKVSGIVLEDRTIYEDFHIFGKAQKMLKHLSEQEYGVYQRTYELMLDKINKPNILVYLQADTPTLMNRIAKRGRDSEKSIEKEYIDYLNTLYESFIKSHAPCPILMIDAKENDNMDQYLLGICGKIKDKVSELHRAVT
ncbi:MAG TPA: deoxynucleoside kinase [Gammaproteobacteria bacterium]|nr:deoxynucleoside kinase [Gammaproteobacteria bacterium]